MNTANLMKVSAGVAGIVTCLMASPAAAQCTPPPSGLISWWPAEGDATDLNGGNNGTIDGFATFAAGMVNQAFKFGGATNDAVSVGAAPNLQLQSFTVEAWVSRASTLKSGLSSFNGTAVLFAFGTNGFGFGMSDDGRLLLTKLNVDLVSSTSVAVTDLGFHHVAVTKAGTVVTFSVDGVAETAPSYGSVFDFTTNAAIGARGDDFSASFLGVIDELSVYNRDLTSDEIQAIVAAGNAGKCMP
jgi:hypothetical protein